MKKNLYVDFFESCRIYFNGEKFEFNGYGGKRSMPTKTLSSDEESWINCWETIEKTGISVNPLNGEPDYTCFVEPYYFSDHGYYCFVEYYLDGDEEDGVFRIKIYEFVHPDDTERIAELDKIVKNSQGVYLK